MSEWKKFKYFKPKSDFLCIVIDVNGDVFRARFEDGEWNEYYISYSGREVKAEAPSFLDEIRLWMKFPEEF